MVKIDESELKLEAIAYRPCPQCFRGHYFWEGDCEKCGECGREFNVHGLLIANARCEGDLDGWGTLC